VLRAQRLTGWALLGDAAFGVVGLAVMSAATTMTPGRAGSLNWMLPYTGRASESRRHVLRILDCSHSSHRGACSSCNHEAGSAGTKPG